MTVIDTDHRLMLLGELRQFLMNMAPGVRLFSKLVNIARSKGSEMASRNTTTRRATVSLQWVGALRLMHPKRYCTTFSNKLVAELRLRLLFLQP